MKKIAALQSLRALAFLEIFLAHCGVSPYMGALGVSIFIVLSGFCMAINYIPRIDTMPETLRGSVRFAVSKVKKLYLLHVIMTLCAVALRGVPQSVPDVLRLVINILLLQSLFPSSSVYFAYNGIAWYLSTYMFICLAAPFILRRISAASGKRLAIYASVSACVMLIPAALLSALRVPVGDDFAKWFTYICPAYRLLDFTLGAILGQVYLTRGAAEGARPRLLMHAVIAAGLLAAWLLIPAAGFDGYRYTLLSFWPLCCWCSSSPAAATACRAFSRADCLSRWAICHPRRFLSTKWSYKPAGCSCAGFPRCRGGWARRCLPLSVWP